MKIILIFSILFLSFASFSQKQKVKVKNDIVTLDGSPLFKIVSSNYPDGYTFYSLDDDKLAVFNSQFYNDPKQVTAGSPEGRVGYFEITFFNEDLDKCEIRIVGFKKQLAQHIISAGLIVDGELDETAVKQFCVINGSKFSEDRKNSGTTIIINNN
ncbi:hypothetical protein ERX46_02760 [Brumimicrobium glaciale]|uniref:Uncharacterized protein n=1 Tax=Brumimicrobium glaciale TaxID=200475 RepID=A0A4Q4KSJ4_9FLAO|nr:hypothetical protein [Brumimicrobium glaciale]RYM35932.1 hypothetical protein ERX46_02760 [Brumimicrobium glaciale]